MMHRIGIVLAVFVAMFLIGCGGGEAKTSPTVSAEDAELINITITDKGIEPQRIEIEAGKTYLIRATNTHPTQARALLANRWRITLLLKSGETEDSDPFTESVPGEYEFHERTFGSRAAYQGVIVVK